MAIHKSERTLSIDDIKENTAGSGVTIDGTLLRDGVSDGSRAFFTGRNDGLTGTGHTTTEYFFLNGIHNASATESDREALVPADFELVTLVVSVTQNNVDNPSTITVRKNGADTGLQASVSANSTGTVVATGSETFTQGDVITVELTVGAGATGDTLTLESWSIECKRSA